MREPGEEVRSGGPQTYGVRVPAGGGCLTGVEKDKDAVDAILNAIEGSRALYRAQGKLTVRIENPPEE